MDSAAVWVLGICGAVIGGIILLFLEYGYFQKKKQKESASEKELIERTPVWT